MISVLAARCPELDAPMFGAVTVTGHSIGDIATYVCIVGFEVVGTETRTCQQVDAGTAMWTGFAPICRRRFLLYVTINMLSINKQPILIQITCKF